MSTIHKIQVIGSGCSNCKKLYEATKQVVNTLGSKIEVEYITDVTQLLELGIMQSPALVIDGKPIAAGFIPSAKQLEELIGGVIDGPVKPTASGGCGCGGRC